MFPTAIFHVSSVLMSLFVASVLATPSTFPVDSFIYSGCSLQKYAPNSQYETNVDSLLTSLVNSAMYASYNKFTTGAGSSTVVHGIFQCRPDLQLSDCSSCVASSVSQLGVVCINSCGGVIQFGGCFVKYDNVSFLGVEDKTVVVKKCGPPIGYDSGALNQLDSALSYLTSQSGLFRVWASGDVRAVAECVGDLSAGECQDCLSSAVGLVKSDCLAAAWGDVFLTTCYARFSFGGDHSYSNHGSSNNDDEVQKSIAILIGLIAGVALLVFLLAFWRKSYEERTGGK
ncbi:hypothetical protein Nepgr_022180 [Nepenthes gracilis]|uniref:Gnk2-homologous domain-containing protein n=1 Tax=Nepenthes gracilis TaxID=150966 RepID=A0AAD3XXT4_NEPGR|nr:hypothetical protein Nepgr_022180 [Nepenthes gracilis]